MPALIGCTVELVGVVKNELLFDCTEGDVGLSIMIGNVGGFGRKRC